MEGATSNLVSAGKVIGSISPKFGAVELTRGDMAVSDRFGRSVKAIVAKVPFAHTGFVADVAVYGRLDDKTGKITYTPSIPRGLSGDADAKDSLKGHIVSAIKGWPDWTKVRQQADHACRTGKVKATSKDAAGKTVELETSLESGPDDGQPVEVASAADTELDGGESEPAKQAATTAKGRR
jgi:hypothetical protein